MGSAMVAVPTLIASARRFLRTPKGILALLLGCGVALALPSEDAAVVMPGLLAAVLTAAIIDIGALRLTRGVFVFPSGAILTGFIVPMILSPYEPLFVPVAASALAICSKRLLRAARTNIFNPAAFGLVGTSLLFDSGHSWWGALPGLEWAGILAVTGAGIFIADRVNKLPVVLAFLGSYFLFFTVAAALGDSADYADLFRSPDLHATLFLAFFMATDPPTCPVRYRHQIVFAGIVTVTSFAVYTLIGAVWFLPGGLLAGNLYEAGRKLKAGRNRRRRRGR